MKKTLIGSGVVAALLLAGCAAPPEATTSTSSTTSAAQNDFLACMVSDEGACHIWWSSGVRPDTPQEAVSAHY